MARSCWISTFLGLIIAFTLSAGGLPPAQAAADRPIAFLSPVEYVIPGTPGTARAPDHLEAADFDGDGKVDLAVTANANVSIFYGIGDGTLEPKVDYPVSFTLEDILAADVNADGRLDLVVSEVTASAVAVLTNLGSRTFSVPIRYPVGTRPMGVTANYFNADAFLDLAVANHESHSMSVLLNRGDGTFGAATNYGGGSFPGGVVSGDFNRDGRIDLAMSNYVSGNVLVYFGNGAGGFTNNGNYGVGTYPARLTTDDFNGDGVLDLATANTFSHNVSILLGNPNGTFLGAVNYAGNTYPHVIDSVDLDKDGDRDLAMSNNGTGYFTVLENLGPASFALPKSFTSNGTNVRTLTVGDFNGDGGPDVAVNNEHDESVSVFINGTVLPITVTAPNGGEVQPVGTTEVITWTSRNVTGNVKIEWSTNGGASWTPIYNSTENDGFAVWTVQGPDTGQARIRVSPLNNPAGGDTSNANFTIISPTIRVLSPNGGEVQAAGSNQNITWTTVNLANNVNIEYSTNGGATWIPIYYNTENDGVATWTVQPPATTQARIRVWEVSNPSRQDTSDGNFTITSNSLILTAPNGGDVLVAGTSVPITWLSQNVVGNVKLEYSLGSGAPDTWFPIADSTENDGLFLWNVPASPSTTVRVRVLMVLDTGRLDASDADFTISSSAAVQVAFPNGGESQVVGTIEPIAWTSSGLIGDVKIDYSTNGGLTWNPIYGSTENDGFALWTVQGPVTGQARIRVSSVADPTLADISNSSFTIRPDLVLHYLAIADLAIPDNNGTGIEVPLLVSSIHKLHAVHVAVNITHPNIGDLEVTVIHPDGTPVKLHNQTGGSADNLVTKYPIFTAAVEDLGALNGRAVGGTWKLRVKDLAPGNTGRLNSWILTTVY
jgi:proprotein convertase P-domain-containing protein/VCBS repeat protein